MHTGKKKLLLAFICFAASFSAIAETMVQTEQNDQPDSQTPAVAAPPTNLENHMEFVLAGGIAGVHTRDSQMQVNATETDTLAQTNSYRWDAGTGQLGVGYVFYWVNGGPRISDELRWFPSFKPTLNLYYSSLTIDGDIYQFKNVLLNAIRYQTTIKNTRLLLDGVLTIVSKGGFSIHGLLGIGEGWSRIAYSDKLGTNTRIDLNSESETNVVWEFGAGLEYAFSRNFSLSLDYIWTDLGRMHTSNTGVAYNVASPQIIGANFQVTTQAILLGVHWGLG